MLQDTKIPTKWAVASYELQDASTDFILSRQAMLCSPKTIRFYHFTAGRFVKYVEENGVTKPEELTGRYIRAYLGSLVTCPHGSGPEEMIGLDTNGGMKHGKTQRIFT